jgi:hypothetical protein
MAAVNQSIIGGSGAGTINISFTAYGSQYALSYVEALDNAIQGILDANGGTGNTTPLLPTNAGAFAQGGQAPDSVATIYQLKPGSGQGPFTYDITTAGYVIDTISGATTINLDSTGAGDSVLVAAINPETTVNSAGTDNLIVFIDGNNTYNGGTSTGDTVVGGTGDDTINTGSGNTLVRSGTGHDSITLNDTGPGAYNDTVFIDSGNNLVIADGTGDYVVATTEGQTIEGGAGEQAGSNLTVLLLPNSDASADGNDLVTGGAGYLTVGDYSDNNTINGGTGGLTFIGAANVIATINAGTSEALIYGNTGDNLTVGDVGGDNGGATFYAGTGNETLNGAGATGNLTLYGAAQADSVGASDSLVGGSGNNTLVAGAGSETLTGGAGDNTFLIDSVAANNSFLTINDFTSNDTLALNYTQAEIDNALSGGTEVNGNYLVTFDNANGSTTVTFTNTTGSALDGHIVTF